MNLLPDSSIATSVTFNSDSFINQVVIATICGLRAAVIPWGWQGPLTLSYHACCEPIGRVLFQSWEGSDRYTLLFSDTAAAWPVGRFAWRACPISDHPPWHSWADPIHWTPTKSLEYKRLENYQALLWWIFQMGKFLREKATLIKSEILK